MKSIEQDKRMIEFGQDFTEENLFGLIHQTFQERDSIRAELLPVIEREKEKASKSASYLVEYF